MMDYLKAYSSGSISPHLGWLFLLTYLLHVAEEYWAGFPAYLWEQYGVELSPGRFVVLQIAGLILMGLGILLSRRLHFTHLLLAILGAVVLGNALIHLFRSVMSHAYEPGLVTALFLWLPLGALTLLRLRERVGAGRYALGIIIGVVICGVVEIITLAPAVQAK